MLNSLAPSRWAGEARGPAQERKGGESVMGILLTMIPYSLSERKSAQNIILMIMPKITYLSRKM